MARLYSICCTFAFCGLGCSLPKCWTVVSISRVHIHLYFVRFCSFIITFLLNLGKRKVIICRINKNSLNFMNILQSCSCTTKSEMLAMSGVFGMEVLICLTWMIYLRKVIKDWISILSIHLEKFWFGKQNFQTINQERWEKECSNLLVSAASDCFEKLFLLWLGIVH